jgi:hypothetical protein
MVRRAADDFEGAVDLLEDDDPREPVGQRQLGEAPSEAGARPERRVQAFVAADAERERARAQRRDSLRELLGRKLRAALIQSPELALQGLPGERRGFARRVRSLQFDHFDFGEARDAARVLPGEGKGLALVLADGEQPDFQTWTRGASAQRPSRS